MRIALVTLSTLMILGAAAPVVANPQKGQLTSVDLKDCKELRKHRDGGAWRCPGLPGYPVYIADGDQRHMLAFGEDAERRLSATQSLRAFNTIFEGKSRPTIEWRVTPDLKGRERPYATIVRYHTSNDTSKGEVLLITKVDSRVSCHLAVVDAEANENAMALAREWADANARLLPCPSTPKILGKSGQSPM